MYTKSPITVLPRPDFERERQKKRLRKRAEDPNFRSYLASLRKKISSGKSLMEIREEIGLNTTKGKDERLWQDLISCLATSFISPQNMLLEWQVRQQARYQMAADLYMKAKDSHELNEMGKAIMIMTKIDENAIELQKALGFLKPFTDPETGGEGISDEDLRSAEEHFNTALEQKIFNKLQAQREAEHPITIDVLNGFGVGGEADRLDQAPLAEGSPIGSEP